MGAHTDTELVLAARRGEQGAFAELFERWFDRAYDVARNVVRNDDTAAEVAQDTFLAAWQGLGRLDNPDAFGGWVLRIARNRALNRLERERRSQPLDTEMVTGAHDGGAHDPTGSSRLIETEAITEVRDRQELLWAAAAALGERDASVLDLHLRHGLAPAEIAEELGVTANNAHQLLFRLRNRLGAAVSGYLLWRNGRPRCATLSALVGGGTTFDANALKVIDRHVAACQACEDQRHRVVEPHRLFAATPILVAPALLKAKAARALSQAGVPVDPSSAGMPPDGPDPFGPSASADAPSGSVWPAPTVHLGAPPVPSASAARRRRRSRALTLAAAAVVLAGVLYATTRTGERPELVAPPPGTAAPAVASTAPPTTIAASTTAPTTTVPPTTTTSTVTTTTAPSTTQPLVPVTTAPRPPTTVAPQPSTTAPPPPSTTTSTIATTTLPPAPAPVIVRFSSAAPVGVTLLCSDQSSVPRRFVWSTRDATSAVLTIAGVDTSVDPSGSRTTCAPSGSTVTLTAIGPGGTVQATTPVP